MHRIEFESPFYFGDVVEFDSRGRTGRGRVADIVLSDDRTVYYVILADDEADLFGGIYPEDMRLVQAAGRKPD